MSPNPAEGELDSVSPNHQLSTEGKPKSHITPSTQTGVPLTTSGGEDQLEALPTTGSTLPIGPKALLFSALRQRGKWTQLRDPDIVSSPV